MPTCLMDFGRYPQFVAKWEQLGGRPEMHRFLARAAHSATCYRASIWSCCQMDRKPPRYRHHRREAVALVADPGRDR